MLALSATFERIIMTKVIGLTGGIATGKTTVSNLFRQAGIPVIDADLVARQVQTPDSIGLTRLVKAFGAQILLPTGQLNRAALGKIIFNSIQARQKLNEIMQPLIWDELWQQVTHFKRQNLPLVVIDVPLLFEQHYDEQCDYVVVVYTDKAIQLTRLMARDNSTKEEALARINAQLPLAKKAALADRVINNNVQEPELHQQVAQLISDLQNMVK